MKIPSSIKLIEKFIPHEKTQILIPTITSFENIAKKYVGESNYTLIKGAATGISSGNIIDGIVDSADLDNKEKILDELKKLTKQIIILLSPSNENIETTYTKILAKEYFDMISNIIVNELSFDYNVNELPYIEKHKINKLKEIFKNDYLKRLFKKIDYYFIQKGGNGTNKEGDDENCNFKKNPIDYSYIEDENYDAFQSKLIMKFSKDVYHIHHCYLINNDTKDTVKELFIESIFNNLIKCINTSLEDEKFLKEVKIILRNNKENINTFINFQNTKKGGSAISSIVKLASNASKLSSKGSNFANKFNSYADKAKSYSDKFNSYADKAKSYSDKLNSYKDKAKSYSDKFNSYKDKAKSYSDELNKFSIQDNNNTNNREQPTEQPMGQPTEQPIGQPMGQPTEQPIGQPMGQPTEQPMEQPTGQPMEQTYPVGQTNNHDGAKKSDIIITVIKDSLKHMVNEKIKKNSKKLSDNYLSKIKLIFNDYNNFPHKEVQKILLEFLNNFLSNRQQTGGNKNNKIFVEITEKNSNSQLQNLLIYKINSLFCSELTKTKNDIIRIYKQYIYQQIKKIFDYILKNINNQENKSYNSELINIFHENKSIINKLYSNENMKIQLSQKGGKDIHKTRKHIYKKSITMKKRDNKKRK
jgi:hypothetical protein